MLHVSSIANWVVLDSSASKFLRNVKVECCPREKNSRVRRAGEDILTMQRWRRMRYLEKLGMFAEMRRRLSSRESFRCRHRYAHATSVLVSVFERYDTGQRRERLMAGALSRRILMSASALRMHATLKGESTRAWNAIHKSARCDTTGSAECTMWCGNMAHGSP